MEWPGIIWLRLTSGAKPRTVGREEALKRRPDVTVQYLGAFGEAAKAGVKKLAKWGLTCYTPKALHQPISPCTPQHKHSRAKKRGVNARAARARRTGQQFIHAYACFPKHSTPTTVSTVHSLAQKHRNTSGGWVYFRQFIYAHLVWTHRTIVLEKLRRAPSVTVISMTSLCHHGWRLPELLPHVRARGANSADNCLPRFSRAPALPGVSGISARSPGEHRARRCSARSSTALRRQPRRLAGIGITWWYCNQA